MKRSIAGFTLVEVMIVVVIVAVLSAMAIPRYMRSATKAKQSEARTILKQIYTMQQAYYAEHLSYCLDGVTANAANSSAYSPLMIEIMPSARYTYVISLNGVDHFTCTATANLDDDATIDTWVIDDTGVLVKVIDDSVL